MQEEVLKKGPADISEPSVDARTAYHDHTVGLQQDEVYRGETPPTQTGFNKIRDISIGEVHRGYIVKVGCHTFAISTKQELLVHLMSYINDPAETEKKFFSGELF